MPNPSPIRIFAPSDVPRVARQEMAHGGDDTDGAGRDASGHAGEIRRRRAAGIDEGQAKGSDPFILSYPHAPKEWGWQWVFPAS
jgi:hypothetical protein